MLIHDLDTIPDADRARHNNLAVDPERQRLGRVHVAAVAAENLERLQVDLAGLRVPARDQAATDVPVETDTSVAA